MPNIYLYHPSTATYRGNGGMVFIAQMSAMLANEGYSVFVFDGNEQGKRLAKSDFDWLGLDEQRFELASLEQVLDDKIGVVIGTWLRTLMPILQECPDLLTRFIMRDAGHLLRAEMVAEREFAREHIRYITINNDGLRDYYRIIGIEPTAFWPHWVEDFFVPDDAKCDDTLIGAQTEFNNAEVHTALVKRFGKEHVLLCDGTRREVAEKMQRCGIFFSWNTPAMLLPGDGESFGRSLSEAQACGCAAVARRSVGNLHYSLHGSSPFGSVLFYDRLGHALDGIDALLNDEVLRSIKQSVSALSSEVSFRLGNQHKGPILETIEQIRNGL